MNLIFNFFFNNNITSIKKYMDPNVTNQRYTSIPQIVDFIFAKSPSLPGSYNLILPSKGIPNTDEYNASIFPYLMGILITGAKKLFGEDITPATMSEEQFDLLKKYILSIGFQVKHEYTYLNDSNIPNIINIWFEPYSPKVDCHGRIVFT